MILSKQWGGLNEAHGNIYYGAEDPSYVIGSAVFV